MQPNEHEVADLWWKNAVMYCLDVETFYDADGDGHGDFRGLTQRLDYLAELGVTCIWLMPFYPSPSRDDGYDISDYFGIDSRLGHLGDFTDFVQTARHHGIRVIADLVINHTSNEHPWFQDARRGPESPYHDFYVWRDERPDDWETALIFPGEQKENWTYDRKAGRYYLHIFYEHQPDLNPANPAVRSAMEQVMSTWLQQDLSGFRVDAVPFLVEMDGISGQVQLLPHDFLRGLVRHMKRRRGDAITLGEINLHPTEQIEYFGDGDQLDVIFNFYVNQYFHLALVRRHADPVRKALDALPDIPSDCQWANFLTNHDELNLDKLTDTERQEVFDALGPDPGMQLFGRGIRRRLPSMLDGDGQALRFSYSLLFSLPGTPVLFYGEEIGMGDNQDVPGRLAVRTAMQWTSDTLGGFSTADPDSITRPPPEGRFGPEQVNAADQMTDPDSMWSFMKRLIAARKRAPEIGHGRWTLVDGAAPPEVLVHECAWRDRRLIAVHNFSMDPHPVDLELSDLDVVVLVDSDGNEGAPDRFTVEGRGYRWVKVTAAGDDSWRL